MRYTRYTAEDFVLDEYFQQWIYSPDEESNAHWNQFLSAYPEKQKDVDEARAFLESIGSKESLLVDDVPEMTIQAIKSRFNEELDKHERGAMGRHAMPRHRPRRILYFAAAALMAVASLLGIILLRSDAPDSFLRALSMEEQETIGAGLRHIVLSDGTQVWLNASSSLRYPADFRDANSREVYLEGEAFFDVFEDHERPFIVRTAGVSIRVLGTTFNVKSYDADQFVETTLVTGEVTIASDQDDVHTVTLKPNQQALYSKASRRIELKELSSTESLTEWRNGWMIFDDQPFSQIRERLERWYQVTIDVEDRKSLSCTFSGKFKDKTLEEILEIFSHTVPIHYQINGDRVLIRGQLCNY